MDKEKDPQASNTEPEENEQGNTGKEAGGEATSSQQVDSQIAEFDDFDESTKKSYGENKLEFLQDLQLNVFIELGRTKMQIKDILELERGYVIELDKMASEPVDIYVNNKKIAEGEVVVIDKHFGIRITNLTESSERLKGLY